MPKKFLSIFASSFLLGQNINIDNLELLPAINKSDKIYSSIKNIDSNILSKINSSSDYIVLKGTLARKYISDNISLLNNSVKSSLLSLKNNSIELHDFLLIKGSDLKVYLNQQQDKLINSTSFILNDINNSLIIDSISISNYNKVIINETISSLKNTSSSVQEKTLSDLNTLISYNKSLNKDISSFIDKKSKLIATSVNENLNNQIVLLNKISSNTEIITKSNNLKLQKLFTDLKSNIDSILINSNKILNVTNDSLILKGSELSSFLSSDLSNFSDNITSSIAYLNFKSIESKKYLSNKFKVSSNKIGLKYHSLSDNVLSDFDTISSFSDKLSKESSSSVSLVLSNISSDVSSIPLINTELINSSKIILSSLLSNVSTFKKNIISKGIDSIDSNLKKTSLFVDSTSSNTSIKLSELKDNIYSDFINSKSNVYKLSNEFRNDSKKIISLFVDKLINDYLLSAKKIISFSLPRYNHDKLISYSKDDIESSKAYISKLFKSSVNNVTFISSTLKNNLSSDKNNIISFFYQSFIDSKHFIKNVSDNLKSDFIFIDSSISKIDDILIIKGSKALAYLSSINPSSKLEKNIIIDSKSVLLNYSKSRGIISSDLSSLDLSIFNHLNHIKDFTFSTFNKSIGYITLKGSLLDSYLIKTGSAIIKTGKKNISEIILFSNNLDESIFNSLESIKKNNFISFDILSSLLSKFKPEKIITSNKASINIVNQKNTDIKHSPIIVKSIKLPIDSTPPLISTVNNDIVKDSTYSFNDNDIDLINKQIKTEDENINNSTSIIEKEINKTNKRILSFEEQILKNNDSIFTLSVYNPNSAMGMRQLYQYSKVLIDSGVDIDRIDGIELDSCNLIEEECKSLIGIITIHIH
jgi:hypothetical protein